MHLNDENADASLKGILSWLWGTFTLSKFLITTRPLPPLADIAIDLSVCIFSILAFVFAASVHGPMQWLIDGLDSRYTVVYAGSWETTGIVALTLLL